MGPGRAGAGPCAAQGADPKAALDARFEAMKSQLKITPEQDAAWQAYATQMSTQFQSMQAWMATMHSGTPTTAAERIELHSAMLKQRAEVAEATGKAFKGLYEVLTPEQRALVDQGPFAMGPGYGRGPGGRYR
jgi:Spy/CpxP family protein refolding chaperone